MRLEENKIYRLRYSTVCVKVAKIDMVKSCVTFSPVSHDSITTNDAWPKHTTFHNLMHRPESFLIQVESSKDLLTKLCA